ncbi:RNA polymerase sigma factor [Luteimonas sp. R10]|uniref:RNA polymerase sigma factor n=1 Tax=Luteimonas sp. R10 TaxID=3108176 RepID=UPI0030873A6B|nr:sigma-70 family RNA polymerase sigma factor [Luteimonas sp. R10]
MTRPTPRLIDSFLGLYDELVRHLRRRVGDSERARDVAQDTYLRLLDTESRQGRQEEIRDARAFIYRVAGNLAIDAARRDQRTSGEGEPDPSLPDPVPDPEHRAVVDDRLRQLDRALRELPPNARLALLLFRVDGLSHAQIARRLSVSESMVAKYLAQALRHCRDRLSSP